MSYLFLFNAEKSICDKLDYVINVYTYLYVYIFHIVGGIQQPPSG